MAEEVGLQLQLPDFEESDFYVEQEQVSTLFYTCVRSGCCKLYCCSGYVTDQPERSRARCG